MTSSKDIRSSYNSDFNIETAHMHADFPETYCLNRLDFKTLMQFRLLK